MSVIIDQPICSVENTTITKYLPREEYRLISPMRSLIEEALKCLIYAKYFGQSLEPHFQDTRAQLN